MLGFVRQEETRKKKKKIQELKAELARLQDIERQSKQYEERSLESLEEELAKHKQEMAELSVKIGEAAQEELDWVRNALVGCRSRMLLGITISGLIFHRLGR